MRTGRAFRAMALIFAGIIVIPGFVVAYVAWSNYHQNQEWCQVLTARASLVAAELGGLRPVPSPPRGSPLAAQVRYREWLLYRDDVQLAAAFGCALKG